MKQYGIRLRKSDLTYAEFMHYLKGIDGETSLGYLVRIRQEDDPKRLKEFTSAEHSIRNSWRERFNVNENINKKLNDNSANVLLSLFKSLSNKNKEEKIKK